MDLSSATRNNSVNNYVCVCEFEVLMLTVRKVLAAGVGGVKVALYHHGQALYIDKKWMSAHSSAGG